MTEPDKRPSLRFAAGIPLEPGAIHDFLQDLETLRPARHGRFAALDCMQQIPPHSPLHDQLRDWWSSSLACDNGTTLPQRIGEFRMSYAQHPHLGPAALTLLTHMLADDLRACRTPELYGQAFVILRDSRDHPDLRKAACRSIIATERQLVPALPPAAAEELLHLAAENHDEELAQAARVRLAVLPAPALHRIARSLPLAEPDYTPWRDQLSKLYRPALLHLMTEAPLDAHNEIGLLQSEQTAGRQPLIMPETTLIRRLTLTLCQENMTAAVTQTCSDILQSDHTPTRLARLAIHQAVANALPAPLALTYLAHLHSHLLHARDLARPSRERLFTCAASQPLSSPQQELLQQCCLGDDVAQLMLGRLQPVAPPPPAPAPAPAPMRPRSAFARLIQRFWPARAGRPPSP